MRSLSQRLLSKLQAIVPDLVLVGDEYQRLPNTLNILFPGVSGRQLLASCPGVLASNGSACHADSEEPSAILLALGISRAAALGTVRLSVGRTTTIDDVESAARQLGEAWRNLAKTPPKI
jgi:cysteine desulfurase